MISPLSNEESNSNSHSSVVGSLLESSGNDSNSEPHSLAPVQDPNAEEDELTADADKHMDDRVLATLVDELQMTNEKLHEMN